MLTPGTPITITLPRDVAPWWNPDALGAEWDGEIVCLNGDCFDVTTPDGGVEPVPRGWCVGIEGVG